MTMHSIYRQLLVVLAIVLASGVAHGQDELARRSSWSVPSAEQVKSQLDGWLADRQITDEQRTQIDALWQPASDDSTASDPTASLTRLVESAAIAWPEAAEVVAHTKQLKAALPVKHFDLLAHPAKPKPADSAADKEEGEAADAEPAEPAETAIEAPPVAAPAEDSPAAREAWIKNNLRLYYARWLAQHELYDESLELIEPLTVDQVADPASLLFYQSAAYHFLLRKTKGLAAIDKLLENDDQIARRYSITAKLMAADLKPLKADSLDEVARLMGDIERRLRLQRAGQKVRQEEDDVVAKLDKMIEELEQQQQQQQQSSGGAGNSNNPSQPMQDSNIGGASGEGNVDPKRLAAGDNWGNLPPKERQEALQQITKDLPAHYREAVEEYFRKLARDGVNP